jgi:Protein of unknown function (DUF2637)
VSAEQERPSTKPAPLTGAQRWLAAATGLGCTALAVLGGIGSFQAVADVAARHGFVEHPGRVPLGADLGIIALFLADLLLTWLGMPFPPLRWIAHTLVGATIWFNTAASWGDPLGMAMHAVAPVLIIAWVEGIRHATRTRARMAARRHIEAAQLGRWLLAPVATARLWRVQQLWHIASYADALMVERRRLLAIARLRAKHGHLWRWSAPVEERLVLRFGLEAEGGRLTPPAGDPGRVPADAARPGPGLVPAALARTFSSPVPLERPALAAAPAAASRSTVRAKRTSAKAKRGGRTDKALEFIHTQRAAGVERPDDLHIVLHRDFGLERTQARRFAERHWPATDPSGGGGAAEEGAA